jgi:hypothetical protein
VSFWRFENVFLQELFTESKKSYERSNEREKRNAPNLLAAAETTFGTTLSTPPEEKLKCIMPARCETLQRSKSKSSARCHIMQHSIIRVQIVQ